MYKKRLFFIFLFVSLFSSFLYSQDVDWFIRIRDAEGNIKKIITVEECLVEMTNLFTLRGLPDNNIDIILTNDIQLWQFASQLIEQELMYMKAIEEGYDKDEELLDVINTQKNNIISQLYTQEKIGEDFANVTEAEKRKFFNDNRSRLQNTFGPNVTYNQVAVDIETVILQERMRIEYDRIIEEAKKKYNLTYSSTKDPCISIGDKKIPLSEFNNMFNESLKQSGGNIPAALRVQARDNMFKAFVAREAMLYEASQTGFYDTPKVKTIENYITRSAIIANYLDKKIRSTIDKPTEEEINAAYEQYGKLYKIDSLPYSEAQKYLETIVIDTKTQEEYKLLITDLRYRYNIEKNLDLILKK